MGPGRALHGWIFCGCPWAKHGGHRTVLCLTCKDREARTTIAYIPEHLRTATEVQQSLAAPLDSLERAQRALPAMEPGPARERLAAQVAVLQRWVDGLEEVIAARRKAEAAGGLHRES